MREVSPVHIEAALDHFGELHLLAASGKTHHVHDYNSFFAAREGSKSGHPVTLVYVSPSGEKTTTEVVDLREIEDYHLEGDVIGEVKEAPMFDGDGN